MDLTKSSILKLTDVVLPFEPRIVDAARQTALSERYLLPALPELEAFFLAVRAHVDLTLEPVQPVKLGKTYPLGQCLEISLAVMRLLEQADLSTVPLSGAAVAGRAAFTAFRKAGGALRLVWGDLRGEFFQNAFQLGTLYLDVSNDTVTPTKPRWRSCRSDRRAWYRLRITAISRGFPRATGSIASIRTTCCPSWRRIVR